MRSSRKSPYRRPQKQIDLKEYDPQAIDEIHREGYKIARFSINADAGTTLKRQAIEERLKHVKDRDVIIAHMNKPASDSAEGLSVALADMLRAGVVFVRLDQVDLEEIPNVTESKSKRRGGTL